MNEATQMLARAEQGDPTAAEQLLPLVYDELRKLAAVRLAQERPGQTLSATALVHEAYLRLVGPACQLGPESTGDADARSRPADGTYFSSRGHFFAAAAEAMRRILIDQARRKGSLKRGGEVGRIELAAVEPAAPDDEVDLLALDEALDRLAARDTHAAELVKLRFFAGLTAAQAAAALGVSERTADRVWTYARSFLFKELGPEEDRVASIEKS